MEPRILAVTSPAVVEAVQLSVGVGRQPLLRSKSCGVANWTVQIPGLQTWR